MDKPVLVLGVGNILLRDEGIGVRAVEALAEAELPPQVELLDGGTSGLDLVPALVGRRKVVVVDAIAADLEPGSLLRLTPDELEARADGCRSVHDVGVLEALAVARQLEQPPAEVVLIGVVPGDVSWGFELSPAVQERLPELVRLVRAEL
jgi:hydrogenase maturation protease